MRGGLQKRKNGGIANIWGGKKALSDFRNHLCLNFDYA